MKKLSFLFILFFTVQLFAQGEKLNLRVMNLSEGSEMELPGYYAYLYGMVSPETEKLTVNGSHADLDSDGAFLAYAPVKILPSVNESGWMRGEYTFTGIVNGKEAQKTIRFKVRLPLTTSDMEDQLIDPYWGIKPNVNYTVQPGTAIEVEVKGIPGSKAWFTLSGSDKKYPMAETIFDDPYYWGEAVFGKGLATKGDTVKGVYKGYFYSKEGMNNASIKITLEHPEKGTQTVTAEGNVTTAPDLERVVKMKYDPNLVTARYGPGLGYRLFLQEGIKLKVTGIYGSWLQCEIGGEKVYIPENSAEYLPEGTPLPGTEIEIIRVEDAEKFVTVEFGFHDRVPVEVRQYDNPMKLEVITYNVTPNTDWIRFGDENTFIDNILHYQDKDGIYKTEIFLNQKAHWGYEAYYEGNILKIKINKPAKANEASPLAGRRISIDPGHSPESGAVGPRGTREKDVNFAISLKLKDLLEKEGAEVFMTRIKPEEKLPLRDRKAKVLSFNPEISVSVHNNAVPQGVDPLTHTGSSVYYYYPQARELSTIIYRNFLKNLGLKNFGLYWDNLYMCRIPEAISLLIEPAFMINPGQEKMLLDEEFQSSIAESVKEGIKQFYKEYAE